MADKCPLLALRLDRANLIWAQAPRLLPSPKAPDEQHIDGLTLEITAIDPSPHALVAFDLEAGKVHRQHLLVVQDAEVLRPAQTMLDVVAVMSDEKQPPAGCERGHGAAMGHHAVAGR